MISATRCSADARAPPSLPPSLAAPPCPDFRDSAPEPLEAVFRLYAPVVQPRRWSQGLLEMWFFKNKPVKHSVHIPCERVSQHA